MTSDDYIEVIGARIHNLKQLNVRIPKNKIVAFTGVSGSGKSSLAFDLLFEEGRSRYMQAIGFPPRLESEKQFDLITGLSPTIAVEQRTVRYRNPRSTVGTRTNIYNYLRMLYAAESKRICPICKEAADKNDSCPSCGMKMERMEMKQFSFNEPSGMCLKCRGRGYIQELLMERLIPNPSKTLPQICAEASGSFADLKSWMPSLAEHYGFDINTPFKDLPEKIQHMFLSGSGKTEIEITFQTKQYVHQTTKVYEGVIPHLQRAMEQGTSEFRKKKIEQNYMDKTLCPECQGFRINSNAREALLNGKHIGVLAMMTIEDLSDFLEKMDEVTLHTHHGKPIIKKILAELGKFDQLGLAYLHLNRSTRTLSGGENQRLALMTQMSLGLNGITLILDEPTMGMHEVEKANLGSILKDLRDAGNSILMVEHDEKMIQMADEVIELGPSSGKDGGQIVFQGTIADLKKSDCLSGQYFSARLPYPKKNAKERRSVDHKFQLHLKDVSINNLVGLNADIPLGIMVGIAGMSGSGKSSLIIDNSSALDSIQIQGPKASKAFAKRKKSEKSGKKALENSTNGDESENPEKIEEEPEEEDYDPFLKVHGTIDGWEEIVDCIIVDQSPIGRNRNSFPASYIGMWDYIRKLFAKQPAAKEKSFTEGHFSFNSDKGRCPQCHGEGRITVSVSFLDEMSIICEECGGQRYLSEILTIKYHHKNIREILELTVTDALEIFKEEPRILEYLRILDQIGMGYMTLGQSATTLSGGEAQRVKLAKALGNANLNDTKSLFIMDEPTTGLHFHDEVKLLKLLEELVTKGNSVFIIEHNPNMLNYCDWILEMGPKGGPKGGKIIAESTPETLIKNPNSIIGKYLKK